jgi:WD40 repeat protein
LRGTSATFSSDGKTLAVIGADGTIGLWDVPTGKERIILPGEAERIAFSPDGKILASGTSTTVQLWDLAAGVVRHSMKRHGESVSALAFSPDGRTLAWGALNSSVQLWDIPSGNERATLRLQDHPWGFIEHLAFSPDGATLAAVDAGGAVRVWDVAAGTSIAAFDPRWEPLDSLAFSPDGKTLATLCCDSIKIWDAASGRLMASCDEPYRQPRPRLLRWLRSFLDDHPGVAGAFPGIIKDYTNCPRSVQFTPEGKLIALGHDRNDDRAVKMWGVVTAPAKTKSNR